MYNVKVKKSVPEDKMNISPNVALGMIGFGGGLLSTQFGFMQVIAMTLMALGIAFYRGIE